MTQETERLPMLIYRSSVDPEREITMFIERISRWPSSWLCRAENGRVYNVGEDGSVSLIGHKSGGQIVGNQGRLI